jgi:hypothetical protein
MSIQLGISAGVMETNWFPDMKASRLIFTLLLASSVAVVQLAAQQTKADQKPIKEKLCKLAERLVGLTDELTCERPSTASQVERLVGHRNFNAQFLSKRSTIDWACFLREAKNF